LYLSGRRRRRIYVVGTSNRKMFWIVQGIVLTDHYTRNPSLTLTLSWALMAWMLVLIFF